MRQYLFYIMLLIFPLSCTDDYDESLGFIPSLHGNYLAVNKNSFSFPAEKPQPQQFSISCESASWRFTRPAEWISLSDMSSDGPMDITMCVTENLSTDTARTSVFYLQSTMPEWTFESPMSVSQSAATPYIRVQEKSIQVRGAATTASIAVDSNCEWRVSASRPWLSVSKSGSTIIVDVAANETETLRSALITLRYNNVTEVLSIDQLPATITSETQLLSVGNEAADISFVVKAESPWTASTSASWVNVSPESASAGTQVMVASIAPNTTASIRKGYIYFEWDGRVQLMIPVEQSGIYIRTDAEIEFSSHSEKRELLIESNTEWKVLQTPAWVSMTPSSASGTKNVSLSVDENESLSGREGKIILGLEGYSYETSILVRQTGKNFEVGTTYLEFSDLGGSYEVSVSADGNWAATPKVDWLSTKQVNSLLTITASENLLYNDRDGLVVVSLGPIEKSISVHQLGKFFSVDDDALDMTSTGGVVSIHVATNDTWSAYPEAECAWITLSETTGVGDADIHVTVADNPSVNNRNNAIIVETKNGKRTHILIEQSARYLKTNVKNVAFFAKGGQSDPIVIETDGLFDASCSADWMQIERSGNVLTLTADATTEEKTRTAELRVALTDLEEGTMELSIPITQLGAGFSFVKNGYSEEKNYDCLVNPVMSISVIGYSVDKSYDKEDNPSLNLQITGYREDTDHDNHSTSDVSLGKNHYGEDNNQDDGGNSSADVGKTDYGDDNVLDTSEDADGEIEKDGYGEDHNQDKEDNPLGQIDRLGYPGDNNYDEEDNNNNE